MVLRNLNTSTRSLVHTEQDSYNYGGIVATCTRKNMYDTVPLDIKTRAHELITRAKEVKGQM